MLSLYAHTYIWSILDMTIYKHEWRETIYSIEVLAIYLHWLRMHACIDSCWWHYASFAHCNWPKKIDAHLNAFMPIRITSSISAFIRMHIYSVCSLCAICLYPPYVYTCIIYLCSISICILYSNGSEWGSSWTILWKIWIYFIRKGLPLPIHPSMHPLITTL